MAVTITEWNVEVNSTGIITIFRRREGFTDPEGGTTSEKQRKGYLPSDYADAAAMTIDMDAKLTTFLAAEMTAQQITDYATELVRVAFAFYTPEP